MNTGIDEVHYTICLDREKGFWVVFVNEKIEYQGIHKAECLRFAKNRAWELFQGPGKVYVLFEINHYLIEP